MSRNRTHRTGWATSAWVHRAVLLMAVGALVACGGGGGDSGTPTPSPSPQPSPQPTSNTVVSGKITFDRVPHDSLTNGLNYQATREEPARRVTVQILDAANAVLATTVTDDNGDYSMTVAEGQNVRVRVRAELLATGAPAWNFSVVDNTAGDALYVIEGPEQVTSGATETRNLLAASGWDGSAYTSDRSAAPFAILDSVYDAVSKVLAEDGTIVFPPLRLHWSENNRTAAGDVSVGDIGSSFYTRDSQGNSKVYLLGDANLDTDEYDTHVVIHEWGHYLEDRFSRSDSMGGQRVIGEFLDPRIAFSEGFGYAFAGMVTDDPVARDSFGANQAVGFPLDAEDDDIVTNPFINANPGWYSEGSIQLILYDIYDSDADGIDSVALGFGAILDVLRGDFSTDTAMSGIHSFIAALKANEPSSAAAIDVLLEAKGIVAGQNDRYGTAETNNAGDLNDVLPMYTAVATDGTPQVVCSIGGPNGFGIFNNLSNRRLLRFNVTAAGRYRMAVTGAQDPDIVLFQGDFLAFAENPGDDAIDRFLSVGEYVLEVYDYANVEPEEALHAPGRYCLTVTVSAI